MYEPFAEVRFEIGVPKSSGGYGFKTNVVKAGSAMERRVEHNLNPKYPGLENEPMYEGDLGNLVVTQCELDYVTNFFNARRGKSQGFRFKNWADYKCTHLPDYGHKGESSGTYTQGITYPAIADGVNKVFKTVKMYNSGGQVTLKSISKIVANTPKIHLNGTLTNLPIVDINTGFIFFRNPPALGTVITHTCEFDLPVRFDTDELIGSSEFHDQETGRLCYTYGGLPIVEYAPRDILPITPAFPNPPPFTGGQCPGVVYNVVIEHHFGFNQGGILNNQLRVKNYGVFGKVIQPEMDFSGYNSGNNFRVVYLIYASNPDGSRYLLESLNTFNVLTPYIKITSVARADGLPDNCGDPAPL